jgi:hypothetical protein
MAKMTKYWNNANELGVGSKKNEVILKCEVTRAYFKFFG